MRAVYDAVVAARPGMIVLTEDDFDWLNATNEKREDKDFYAVHEDDDGVPDAYATYHAQGRVARGIAAQRAQDPTPVRLDAAGRRGHVAVPARHRPRSRR